jgi:hypothetical protein
MPEHDIVIASTTASQAELDAVTGANTEPEKEQESREAQEQPPADDQAGERHKSRSFQKRIDGLVRKSREADDRAAAFERENAELRAELNRFKPDASGVTEAMRAEVQQLSHLAGINHFLSTNPHVAAALNAMPAGQVLAELKRMNADFEAAFTNNYRPEETEEPEPGHRTSRAAAGASRAPAPIKPISGNGVRPPIDLNDPNVPYREWRAVRDKQEKAWRRGVQR